MRILAQEESLVLYHQKSLLTGQLELDFCHLQPLTVSLPEFLNWGLSLELPRSMGCAAPVVAPGKQG
jgi:hypothetical protein